MMENGLFLHFAVGFNACQRATSTVSTAVTPVPRLPSEITGQPVEKMHQSLIKAGVYDSFVKINSCINAIGHYFVVGLHGHVLALSLGL
ncbi:unnamed protein product [Camellia sinensis]